ncbi:MAG TPA: protocatechuate 3,4-dioxygenase subunit alpha [Beijerinckiaceae bacterium]|jgi:protocatechuate 3,4-dioxygenase alpha subunit
MTDAAGGKPAPPEGITPSQTAGPYFAYALTPAGRYAISDLATNDLVTDDAAGARITIEGRVVDGDGELVTDAMLELWQADGQGRYPGADPALSNARFKGFGRCECDAEGRFSFRTVKPGPAPGPNGAVQAPHIDVGVFARGILRRLFTRIYFEDEAGNAADSILALVPPERRGTLIAKRTGEGAYVFDIRLQGENETVFFEA